DGCRAPIPWTGAPDHGWGVTDAWLPWPPDADERNVEAQVADPSSIAHLYRRLIAVRKASPALQLGDQELLDRGGDLVAWRRTSPGGDGDDRGVVVNMVAERARVDVSGTVLAASDREGQGEPFTGRVGPAGDGEDRVVVVNMGAEAARVDLSGTVLVASDGEGEGEPFTGKVGPDSAVLLRPAP